MKLSARSAALYSSTLGGLLLLSACGKHESAPATPPATASKAASAPTPVHAVPARAGTAMTTAKPASTATSAVAGSNAAATAAATGNAFRVSEVILGDAVTAQHKVSKPRNRFAPTQKIIYASVLTTGKTSAATLGARWSYEEGKPQLISDIRQALAADGPAVTTFKVQNPNPWPLGKYKVEITLDGKSVRSETFEIKTSS